MKTKSAACAALALLLISSGLTGCGSASSVPKAWPQLYQPRVLRLGAGQPVETRDGRYLPQVDETWHSAAAYEALEASALNLSAALAQERSRNDRTR
jgi:hypothetical protein